MYLSCNLFFFFMNKDQDQRGQEAEEEEAVGRPGTAGGSRL